MKHLNCPLLKNKTKIMKEMKTSLLYDKLFDLTNEDFNKQSLASIFNDLVKNDVEFNYGTLKVHISTLIYELTKSIGVTFDNRSEIILDKLNLFNNLELKKNMMLLTYFHELRHVKQEILSLKNEDYFKALFVEDYGIRHLKRPIYDYSLMESDARYQSIIKFFNLIKDEKINATFEAWLVLAHECFNHLTTICDILEEEKVCIRKEDLTCDYFMYELQTYIDSMHAPSNLDIDYKNIREILDNQSLTVYKIYQLCCKNLAVKLKNYKKTCNMYNPFFLKKMYAGTASVTEIKRFIRSIMFRIFNSEYEETEVNDIEEYEKLL